MTNRFWTRILTGKIRVIVRLIYRARVSRMAKKSYLDKEISWKAAEILQ